MELIDIMQAMRLRHSVRTYLNRPIEQEKVAVLQAAIGEVCKASGLGVRLVLNEPQAFSGPMAHYGHFQGCQNYIVITGPKGQDEAVGYYGEKLVLLVQQLGINSCWVALTYNRAKIPVTVPKGQKLHIVIAIGYGANRGVPHKNKPLAQLCHVECAQAPLWFENAMKAVLRAPTAINQQKFHFTLCADGKTVKAKALLGPCAKMDLGIAKYHFELGAEGTDFTWD
jgi:nitroreductase